MYDDVGPGARFGPDRNPEWWLGPHPMDARRLESRDQGVVSRIPAAEQLPPARHPSAPSPLTGAGPEVGEPVTADAVADEPAHVLRRIEATAQAAGALQTALMELELELYRLQRIVRRASPAMAQLMQAATEMRAAGIDDWDYLPPDRRFGSSDRI